jgi:hypothetical protein
MSKTSEEIYRERKKRVMDAITLGKPDRVPIVLLGRLRGEVCRYQL